MRTIRWKSLGLCLGAVLFLTAGTEQGCKDGLDNRPGEPGIDVGGVDGASWSVTYGETMSVLVKRGAAVVANHHLAIGAGATFDLEGAAIDLDATCRRGDVVCPQGVFPAEVVMTQPGRQLHLLYVDFNRYGPLAEVDDVRLLGNVDSDDDFSIALGVGGATNGVCGLLRVSYATGHIDASALNQERGTRLSGDIVTAYNGGCLLLGADGVAGAGLTVELRIPFSAVRR